MSNHLAPRNAALSGAPAAAIFGLQDYILSPLPFLWYKSPIPRNHPLCIEMDAEIKSSAREGAFECLKTFFSPPSLSLNAARQAYQKGLRTYFETAMRYRHVLRFIGQEEYHDAIKFGALVLYPTCSTPRQRACVEFLRTAINSLEEDNVRDMIWRDLVIELGIPVQHAPIEALHLDPNLLNQPLRMESTTGESRALLIETHDRILEETPPTIGNQRAQELTSILTVLRALIVPAVVAPAPPVAPVVPPLVAPPALPAPAAVIPVAAAPAPAAAASAPPPPVVAPAAVPGNPPAAYQGRVDGVNVWYCDQCVKHVNRQAGIISAKAQLVRHYRMTHGMDHDRAIAQVREMYP